LVAGPYLLPEVVERHEQVGGELVRLFGQRAGTRPLRRKSVFSRLIPHFFALHFHFENL
jgi:hypothetical protein